MVELLIAMTILVILSLVTLNYFGDYARQQQFQRFTEDVGHNISLARQQTLASKDDMVYGLYVGTSTVELFSGPTPVPGDAGNTIIDFSAAAYTATSSFSGGLWHTTFSRISGEATATGTIVLSNSDIGKTATYTIYQSGLVE